MKLLRLALASQRVDKIAVAPRNHKRKLKTQFARGPWRGQTKSHVTDNVPLNLWKTHTILRARAMEGNTASGFGTNKVIHVD
jgi:hypothetical protein